MIGELYPGEFEAMEHNGRMDALEQEPCDDWYDVPSDEMTLEQARQAVKDLRKKLAEYLEQEHCDVFDEYGNYKYPGDVELTEPNTATSMPCEDAISRQAVNEIINDIRDCISVEGYWAFLERLKKLPPVHSQPNKEDIHREREQAYMRGYEDGSRKYRTAQSEDAISRQAAEKITWEEPSYSDALNVLTEVRDKVRALPPVNPQLKTGHWIISPNDCFATCSECGLHGDKGIYKNYGWCPNCGAKMEGKE